MGGDFEWGYQKENGPRNWVKKYKNCSCNEQNQSPIDITPINNIHTSKNLEIKYGDNTLLDSIIDNGKTIKFYFKQDENIIYLEGIAYLLDHVHFHAPSEHTISGKQFSLETHLVHRSAKNELLVIAILGEVHDGGNCRLEMFSNHLPASEKQIPEIKIDLNKYLPKNKSFYYYQGSLTTPPCTEGIKWIVFKNTIPVTPNNLKIFVKSMPINNYRNQQALNGRTIESVTV